MADEVRIGADELKAFAADVLNAAGCTREGADSWADMLIWANLRGADSHGVLRLPRYLEYLQEGTVDPNGAMKIARSDGALVVLDAGRTPGSVGMNRGMDEAIAAAREHSVGWCNVRNTTHSGAIGYFALRAVEAGMVGIVMVASMPFMAYHGARETGVSTNPLAIAVPGGDAGPILFDMSTATVANGKIMAARDRGEAIPVGWGIDAEGRDTTDPAKVKTLLPLGGAKGSGLSLMIEILASVLIGNPVIAPALENTLEHHTMNAVCIAVDISSAGDPSAFRTMVDALVADLKALPKADGVDEILMPGERGFRAMADRQENGIPVPEGTRKRLVALATGLGVDVPAALAG
jgi:ureidoglycolate dehydrogenase (NAD+)